jgi:hypothetical protein
MMYNGYAVDIRVVLVSQCPKKKRERVSAKNYIQGNCCCKFMADQEVGAMF